MRNIISRFPLIAMIAVIMGMTAGCTDPQNNEGGSNTFKVELKEVGAGYVDLNVTASAGFEAAYSIGTSQRKISNPSILFASGKKIKVVPGETLRISADIQENTAYYLYIAAKLDAETYSEIFEIQFTTGEFEFTNMLTVVGVDYDGYKMNIKVPKSVKEEEFAIRYNQSDLMMYNYMTKHKGVDDYFTLLYNASEFTLEDKVLEYSEEFNWESAGADVNEDGVIDDNDIMIRWNPISPGEPVVFVAGEFGWMQIPDDFNSEDNYEVNGFTYPAGWKPGYYLPCLHSEAYWAYIDGSKAPQTRGMNIIDADVRTDIDHLWTGAFERKIFRVRIPEEMEPKVNISVENIGPVNATVIFDPEDGVSQFAYAILDEDSYEMMVDLCDGKEEYLQWAISSFYGYYSFGTGVSAGYTEIVLEDFFVNVPAETKIYVLATAMGGDEDVNVASKQSFSRYEFNTTAKTMGRPMIEVEWVEEETSPFMVAFNVKCTTFDDPTRGPVDECWYGANYKKDFIMEVNSNSSYETLAQSQPFTPEEIAQINTPEGLTIKIPSIDGETTRLAVIGYNVENTSNNMSFKDILECPAVADGTTPYRDYKDIVVSDLFEDLQGEWTMSALFEDGETYSNVVRISDGIKEGTHFPSELPDSVYNIYAEEVNYTEEETLGAFERFKDEAEIYNTNRLDYQNSLLIEGWIDMDKYDRLHYYTPWDLFISRELSSVDEKSMFSDFGPKIYLEVLEGDQLAITADMMYMPAISYVSIPYYMAGYCPQKSSSDGNIVFYYDNYAPLTFPVELSEDGNTITIKPIVDVNNDTWYPNLVGIDPRMGYQMDYKIVSAITLERGKQPAAAQKMNRRHVSTKVDTEGSVMPDFSYKQMTRFAKPKQVRKIQGSVTTVDHVIERMDKAVEVNLNQNR